jgi:hypothetical protein
MLISSEIHTIPCLKYYYVSGLITLFALPFQKFWKTKLGEILVYIYLLHSSFPAKKVCFIRSTRRMTYLHIVTINSQLILLDIFAHSFFFCTSD